MKNSYIRILLVDDQTMYSESVKIALEMQPEFEVIALAKNGYEAIQKVEELNPDITLMDISMQEMDGIDATEEILKKYKGQKIIMVSAYLSRIFILKSIQLGVSGYLLKDEGVSALTNAINLVHRGGEYFSPEVTKILTDSYKTKEDSKNDIHIGELNNMEKEVLKHMTLNMPLEDSAKILQISVRQIIRYRNILKYKLNIS